MTLTRRQALATIAVNTTLGLAGCTNQTTESEGDDNQEDDSGNTDNISEDESQDTNGNTEDDSEDNDDSTEDGSENNDNNTEDDSEDNDDNTEETSNELGIQTGGFSADSFEEIEITVEITGIGNNTSVQYGIQTKPFYRDENGWNPSEDKLLTQTSRWLDTATESGEYTVPFEQVWGGGEYQYRAVVVADREKAVYGESNSFTVQDLDIDAPEIEFGDPSLDTGDPAVVEIPVENVSDVNSGVVHGDVQWIDSSGTYLGDSGGDVYFLRGGEKGVLRVSSYADGITQDSIDDFEYQTRYHPVFEPMERMEIVSSSMSLETPRRNITGTATNELSDPPSYVDAVARFFDSDGVLIGNINDRQAVDDVPAGSNWEFEVRILQNHVEFARAADEYEVVLLES